MSKDLFMMMREQEINEQQEQENYEYLSN